MIKALRKLAIIPLLALLILPQVVLTQSPAELQRRIDQKNAQIAQDQKKLDDASARANTLQNRVDTINAEIAQLQTKIDLANLQIAQTQAHIREAIAKLERAKRIMFENAKTLYKIGDPSTIEILASSENFSEFVNRQEYLETVKETVNRAAREIVALKDELEDKQTKLEEFVKSQEIQQRLVEVKRDEQAQLLAETRGEEALYQRQVKKHKAAVAAAERALAASLSSGNYKVAPVGQVSGNDIVGPVGNSGLSSGPHLHLEVRVGGSHTDPEPYIKHQPVQPPVVSQPYGNSDPIYTSGRHPGTDYAANNGTPIHAIDSGFLYRGCSDQLLGTSNNAYGYVAIVEHSGGHISIYAHMSGGPAACRHNTYY